MKYLDRVYMIFDKSGSRYVTRLYVEKIFVASLLTLCYTCDLAGGVFRTGGMHFHSQVHTLSRSRQPWGPLNCLARMETSEALADPDA